MESDFRLWIKRNVRVGVRRAAKTALFEIEAAARTSWTKVVFHPPKERNIKLNIGAGFKRKNGWVNLDLGSAADVRTDARRQLPFHSGSVSVIYSEHFFEHLEYPEETLSFLCECLRILEPGGLFSVGVPDTELCIRAYCSGEFSARCLGLQPVEWCETAMQHLNFLFHQGGEHKQLYDELTLTKVLANAGFCDLVRREYDPALDSEDRKLGSLYVNARKPKSSPNRLGPIAPEVQ